VSERLRNNLLKYGISFGICLIFAAVHCYSKGIAQMGKADMYRTLSDAFTVPGLLCGFSGVLMWLSKEGALDGVSYVAQYAVKSLLFFARRGALETYKEYVERRREKKKGSFGFLLLVGAVCMAIALVFTGLFYSTY
jgi:hypothetical protein